MGGACRRLPLQRHLRRYHLLVWRPLSRATGGIRQEQKYDVMDRRRHSWRLRCRRSVPLNTQIKPTQDAVYRTARSIVLFENACSVCRI